MGWSGRGQQPVRRSQAATTPLGERATGPWSAWGFASVGGEGSATESRPAGLWALHPQHRAQWFRTTDYHMRFGWEALEVEVNSPLLKSNWNELAKPDPKSIAD